MSNPMEYTPLTREQLTVLTLERLREAKIRQAVENDIFLEALKLNKKKGGSSEQRTQNAVAIRNKEAASIDIEEDIKLVERKLKEAKRKLDGKD